MRKLIPILIILSIATFVWSRREAPKNEPASAPMAVEEKTPPVSTTTVSATTMSEVTPSPTTTAKIVTAIAPSVRDMRADVEADPHAPSKSLVEFSAELAPRLREALQHPATAEVFFAELQDCVDGPTQKEAPTIRALCLINLRRLGKVPRLHEKAESAWSNADPEIRRLAE
jgi:hypothetical protein